MMRMLFTGLAAFGVLAAITLWWRPVAPEAARPVESAAEQAAQSPEPARPVERVAEKAAPAPPAAAEPVARSAEPAAQPASEPAPPPVGTPELEEESLVVAERPDFSEAPSAADIARAPEAAPRHVDRPDFEAAPRRVERPDFESGPPGKLEEEPSSSEPEAGTEPPATPERPAVPVDVERSGDLIRRMLALYGAMRE